MENEIFSVKDNYKTIQQDHFYKLDIEKTRHIFNEKIKTLDKESRPDIDLTTLHFLARDKGITEIYFIPDFFIASESLLGGELVALSQSRVLLGDEVHRMNFNSKMLEFLLENDCITEITEDDRKAKILLQGL